MGEKKHLLCLLYLLSAPSVAPSGSGRNYTNWGSSSVLTVLCAEPCLLRQVCVLLLQNQTWVNAGHCWSIIPVGDARGTKPQSFCCCEDDMSYLLFQTVSVFNLFKKNNKVDVCFSLWVQRSQDQQVRSSRLRPPSNRCFLKLLFFMCVLAFYPNSNCIFFKTLVPVYPCRHKNQRIRLTVASRDA